MMNESCRKAFLDLTKDELGFLLDEFSVDKSWLETADEKTLADLYDKIADVEIEETISAGDSPLSMRGKLASSIVTKIGDTFQIYEDGIDDDWD